MDLAGQQMQDHLGLFILGILLKSWQDLGHPRCNHKWRGCEQYLSA